MIPAGHALTHNPHPTQDKASTTAQIPLLTCIAFLGHTFMQAPQATQFFPTMAIYLLILKILSSFPQQMIFLIKYLKFYYIINC